MNYKRRYSANTETPTHPDVVLARSLLKVGDATPTKDHLKREIEDMLESLYVYLEKDLDHFVTLFIPSVSKQPVKSPIYASLVSILRKDYPTFAERIITTTSQLLQRSLESLDSFKIRLFLRFIGELTIVQVVDTTSYFNLLLQFFNEANVTELDVANNSERRSKVDFFLSIILDVIPFVGKLLYSSKKDEFVKMLNQISTIVEARDCNQTHSDLLNILSHSELNHTKAEKDLVSDKWSRIKLTFNLENLENNYNEASWSSVDSLIIRPSFDDFGAYYSSVPSLAFPVLTISPHIKSIVYERDAAPFHIFPQEIVEKDITPAGRMLIDQYLTDLAITYNNSHSECAHYLFSLPFKGIKIEHLFMENVFGQMLRLPSPKFSEIYYGILIADACKENNKFPAVLAEGVSLIFQRVSEFNAECFDRLVDWFAFHLSNFLWKWNWNDWVEIAPQADEEMNTEDENENGSADESMQISKTQRDLKIQFQRYFIEEVLEKATRLSYLDRIQRTLPTPFHSLLPPSPSPNPRYGDNDVTKSLISLLSSKPSVDQIKSFLGENTCSSEKLQFKIFVEALLSSTAPSSLHTISKLEKYLGLFYLLTEKDERKKQLLSSVHSFWKNSHSHIIIIIDKLMTLKIVDNVTIIKWIFSPKNISSLKHSYMWIIFRNVIKKTVHRYDAISAKNNSLNSKNMDNDDDDNEQIVNNNNHPSYVTKIQTSFENANKELNQVFSTVLQEFNTLFKNIDTIEDEIVKYRINGHMDAFYRKYLAYIINHDLENGDYVPRVSSLFSVSCF